MDILFQLGPWPLVDGKSKCGRAGMVPSGTGTAEEYIAGTAPRGWDKQECYGFIGGGCCGLAS